MTKVLSWPGQTLEPSAFAPAVTEADAYRADWQSISEYFDGFDDEDDDIIPRSDEELLAIARKIRRAFSPNTSYE